MMGERCLVLSAPALFLFSMECFVFGNTPQICERVFDVATAAQGDAQVVDGVGDDEVSGVAMSQTVPIPRRFVPLL